MNSKRDPHRVRVFYEEREEVWKVAPGTVYANPGDSIIWSPEGTDVTIYFPDGQVFLTEKVVINDGQEESLSVKLDAVVGPPHPYAVFCHFGDDFAVGTSHPVMIITGG